MERKPDFVPLPRPRRLGTEGLALIKQFEGIARLRAEDRVEAYPDPGTGAEPWTIGWGSTGPGIAPGTVWTRAQCDARFARDLVRYALDVDRALGDAPTSTGQFDALVSFHYNTGAIHRATLTRKHCSGDHGGAIRALEPGGREGAERADPPPCSGGGALCAGRQSGGLAYSLSWYWSCPPGMPSLPLPSTGMAESRRPWVAWAIKLSCASAEKRDQPSGVSRSSGR